MAHSIIKRVSIVFTIFMVTMPALAENKDLENDITMVSYEQSSFDYEGVIALKNNTNEEIRSVEFRLIYLDMSGNELDYQDFSEFVSIAPGMTKKVNVIAYEKNRDYYYYKTEDADLIPKSYTPFDVKFQLMGYNNGATSNFPPVLLFFGLGILGIIVGIALFVLVGIIAKRYNRDVLLWVVLSFIITPLVSLVSLLIMGKKDKIQY